ncbi:hypothetical protein SAMN05421736_10730 [Evansella caseinilytica]|uniref:Uncharacterized protein n=1 Tax=Evansella caseinilytica TaxID=1503961 RepID=A0A1H3QSL8_9BACI|nr:hypothetical protein [Evansella caseinilytica]SDZ16330.1 hypothetical protein SAMN05421736_10730 [Evansella caseinilytica]
MDKRKLHVWQPIETFKGELHLVEMYFQEGLRFTFEDDGGMECTFMYDQCINGMYVWSCRFTEEFKRSDLAVIATEAIQERFGDKNKTWCFFKMTNSDYVDWYDQLGGPGSDRDPHIQHHIFITSENIFEVLSEYEPKVVSTIKE